MLRSSGYPGRWFVATSFVLAALSAAWVMLWLALGNDDMLMCDFGVSSSLFGSADRSWLPPGTTCSWNVNGIEHVDSPDPSRLAVVAMALFAPGLLSNIEGKDSSLEHHHAFGLREPTLATQSHGA